MNIQFGFCFTLFSQERFLSPLKEKISFTLTNRQKAVMVVAFLSLVLIAASCRLLGRCCDFKASNIPDDDEEESLSEEASLNLQANIYLDDPYKEIFKRLDLPSWGRLAAVNRHLNKISKTPEVLSTLLDTDQIPSNRRLELAKQFKGYLTKMSLVGVPLTGQTLQELFLACPKIVDLDLSFKDYDDCKKSVLTGKDLVHLSQLKLKSLKLHYWDDKLTDADLIQLGQSQPSLESLDLQNLDSKYESSLTNGGLVGLPISLKVLHSNNYNITYQGVKRFHALEALTLRSVNFLDSINIAELPRSLQSLNLRGFKIDSTSLEQLPQGLTSLSLMDIFFDDQAGEQLPPNLKFLKLQNVVDRIFLNQAVAALLQKLLLLESLDLENNDIFFVMRLLFTPEFQALNLKDLNLSNLIVWGNLGLGKEALLCLPPQLESLNLKGLHLLDEWIIELFKRLQSLKFLNLEGCSDLTNAVVPYLPKTLECLICPDGTKLKKDLGEARKHFYLTNKWWPFS